MRVCLVVHHDYPEFFSDFHFNLVNALPEHCIQLRNLVLASHSRTQTVRDPLSKQLKVDLMEEVKLFPNILSNFDNYLSFRNIKEDLEKFYRTKQPSLIAQVCEKMQQCDEVINGRRKVNSCVVNAVVLQIANQHLTKQSFETTQKESMETFKAIMMKLNDETRMCFLNSIVNELRFPNIHAYYFSCIILYLFVEDKSERIQEQIAKILFERLSTHKPHPWGVIITFRELIQNPKYEFMKKGFITGHQRQIEELFSTRLEQFQQFVARPKQT